MVMSAGILARIMRSEDAGDTWQQLTLKGEPFTFVGALLSDA